MELNNMFGGLESTSDDNFYIGHTEWIENNLDGYFIHTFKLKICPL